MQEQAILEKPDWLSVELLSDTTFGRGEGTAGLVDVEVEHDDLGLPFVNGKTLKGLLRDSWLSMADCFTALENASLAIHGYAGDLSESSILCVGHATFDDATRAWFEYGVNREHAPVSPGEILEALTDIRFQTAVDYKSGAPAEHTLRSLRVVLRRIKLWAPLEWLEKPGEDHLRCLALSALGTRHAGLGRNRGKGHVRILIDDDQAKTRMLAKGVSLDNAI